MSPLAYLGTLAGNGKEYGVSASFIPIASRTLGELISMTPILGTGRKRINYYFM